MFIDMTLQRQNLQRAISTFPPSFKHACLFYTKQSQRFAKALSFKSALKIPTDSIKDALLTIKCIIIFLHIVMFPATNSMA